MDLIKILVPLFILAAALVSLIRLADYNKDYLMKAKSYGFEGLILGLSLGFALFLVFKSFYIISSTLVLGMVVGMSIKKDYGKNI